MSDGNDGGRVTRVVNNRANSDAGTPDYTPANSVPMWNQSQLDAARGENPWLSAFATPTDYYSQLFGGGSVVPSTNPTQDSGSYFTPTSGDINKVVGRQASWNPEGGLGIGDYFPAAFAALAAGGMTGMLPGTTSLFGAGAPAAMSSVGAGGGADLGWASGLTDAAGGSLLNPGSAGAAYGGLDAAGSAASMINLGRVAAPGTYTASSAAAGPLAKLFSGDAGMGDYAKLASTALSLGSGIYGLSQASDLRDQAQKAMLTANPWAASGGQALASQQLMALLSDPKNLMNDPGYKARMMGVERAYAPYGQNSGNMAVAAANASGDYYQQRLAALGGLAGAPGSPVGAAQIGLAGSEAANNLASSSLASIGFGVNTATGGGAGAALPPAVRQWLLSQGMVA